MGLVRDVVTVAAPVRRCGDFGNHSPSQRFDEQRLVIGLVFGIGQDFRKLADQAAHGWSRMRQTRGLGCLPGLAIEIPIDLIVIEGTSLIQEIYLPVSVAAEKPSGLAEGSGQLRYASGRSAVHWMDRTANPWRIRP